MLPLQRRFDLGPRRHVLRNFRPPSVRVADDIRRAVVFVGHGDGTNFKSCGTAFLMTHKRVGFLVTASHIAHKLGNDPFSFRVNGPESGFTLAFDPLSEDASIFHWLTHDDPNVDVAVMPFHVDVASMGADPIWLATDFHLTEDIKHAEGVGIGCACHAVGLFQLLQGKKRNLPVIHTGNIALMPSTDELIPVEDWRDPKKTVEVEAYLVEMTNLEGLSGAPVFVRPEVHVSDITYEDGSTREAQISQARLYLMGVWQGSWTAPHDRTMTRYPLGMGVVTPITKVVEILNSPKMEEAMKRYAEWSHGKGVPRADVLEAEA